VEIIFLKSTNLRKSLVLKGFSIIDNYLYYSRYGKLLLSDSNEKRSVKIISHVASRVTKHREKNKNSYENEKYFYKWGTRVEETIILTQRFTDGSATAKGLWEDGNLSLGHAKYTLIN
jgi:hypothetical protein